MQCLSCGNQNDPANKFCSQCGATLSPSLSNTVPPENRSSRKRLLLILLIIIISLAILTGIFIYWRRTKQKLAGEESAASTQNLTATPFSTSSPTQNLLPTSTPEKTSSAIEITLTPTPRIIKFTTIEEAYAFAVSDGKIPDLSNSKMEKIEVLYRLNSKQWTFSLRDNLLTTKIKVSDSGNFSKSTDNNSSNNQQSFWQALPAPSEVVTAKYIDLANEKMIAAGFKPSVLISATYSVCTYCTNYKQEWMVYIPQSGEEAKIPNIMNAKQLIFRDGTYVSINDATLTIYSTLF